MRLTILVEDEARAEFDAAVEHYELQRTGLGSDFVDEIERLLARILEQPEAGVVVRGVPAAMELRRRLAPRFPYAVVYRVERDMLRVYAFAHVRRRPGYWRRRL